MSTPANAIFVGSTSEWNPNNSDQLIGGHSLDGIDVPVLLAARTIHSLDANPVNTSNDNNAVMAVPVQVFDYDVALDNENKEVEEAYSWQEQSALTQGEQGQRTALRAFHIPSGLTPNPDSIADDSRFAVKYAERTGIIRSEEEKDAIRKANLKGFARNYFEAQSIYAANQFAKLRDREGLQVQDDHLAPSMINSLYTSPQSSTGRSKPESDCTFPRDRKHRNGGKGYQVQEYRISDNYETETYEVTEYKSVYD